MPTKRDIDNLRALLVLSLVTLAIAVFLSYRQMPIDEALLPILDARGGDAVVGPDTANLLWIGWLVLYVAAHVLALLGAWFSRHVFVVSFVLYVLMGAVGGLSVGTPWDNTAWSLHTAVATFAIGMLFFSPGARSQARKDWQAFVPDIPGARQPDAAGEESRE